MARKKKETRAITIVKVHPRLEFLSMVQEEERPEWLQEGFTCYMWALGTESNISSNTIELCRKAFGDNNAGDLPGVPGVWRLARGGDFKPYILLKDIETFDKLAMMEILCRPDTSMTLH